MSDLEGVLSLRDAYLAMYEFIRRYYERGPNVALFLLLHSMDLEGQGSTTDPAAWQDWVDCIDSVRAGETIATEHPAPPAEHGH